MTSDNLYDRMEGVPFRCCRLLSDVHEIFIHRNTDGIILLLNITKTSSRRKFFPVEMPMKRVPIDVDILNITEVDTSRNGSGVSG